MRPIAWGALSLLLASCGSSPRTHFFMLSADQGGHAPASSVSFPVQLAAVHIPPALDRRQMVRMTGNNSVEISDTDRWSAPIGQMVRNVLAQDLTARLPEGRVILPDAPAPPGTHRLVVTISRFGPDANAAVRLDGSWVLLAAGADTAVMTRDFQLDSGPAPTADAAAQAMSRALGQLATEIAASLSDHHPGTR